MKRILWTVAVAMIIALIGIVGGAYYYLKFNTVKPISESAISWRAQIYLMKAEGKVPELSWTELLKMTRQEGGFGLAQVNALGQSVEAALSNPYTSHEDREAGGHIFRERCARCHGPGGRGFLGPSLVQSGYKNGDSDLAIYRVLTDGIAGTAMVPTDLSFAERWQVIGYLRNLQLHFGTGDNEPRPLNIQVSSE